MSHHLTQTDATNLFRSRPHDQIAFNGGSVAYRRVGTGPDVLFVHGWPVSGATFRNLLPHLAPHVTCHVIDLVGAGDSRFSRDTPIGFDNHIGAVRHVVDVLGTDSVSLVGQDSGALVARHAMAGDSRVRSMAFANTEQPQGLTQRFKNFVQLGKLPGFGRMLSVVARTERLRRSPLTFGGCFTDVSLLDGEFDEFFMRPLHQDRDIRWAAVRLVRSFGMDLIEQLDEVHSRIDAPVQLVWGTDDPFFPTHWAREMVRTFPDARLHLVPHAKLFVHEEHAREVAETMLPTLVGDADARRARTQTGDSTSM